jgi:hypothetical protein
MARREGLGKRKTPRVDFVRPGFLILEPDGPWVECFVIDVSDGGAGLRVGSLALPDIFVLLLTPGGEVRRLCKLKWRRGELAGVTFISAKELLAAAIPGAPSERTSHPMDPGSVARNEVRITPAGRPIK